MALAVKLTDLQSADINLVYNASSQTAYKLRYNMRIQAAETEILEHVPDYGESVPIRAIDRDRTAFFTLAVDSTSWDTISNKISALKRWVDGADQQALRYWTHGDARPVYLQVQLNGATNYTRAKVKWGFVDDSGAMYTPEARKNVQAQEIVVALRLSPYGEGPMMTLSNVLTSSPHFVEDTDADGLADGMNLTGTPDTYEIADDIYLIGGKSQKIVAPATTSVGVYTDSVATNTSMDIIAYAWVYHYAGDRVTVALENGSGTNIQSKDLQNGDAGNVSDMSRTDYLGNTWYRVSLTQTAVAQTAVRIRVYRATGNATQVTTFYVDGLYLQTLQTLDLLPNSGMDTDIDGDGVVDGWLATESGGGNAALDATFYFSASYSQMLDCSGGASAKVKLFSYAYAEVPQGSTCNFWFWMHLENDAPGTIDIKAYLMDGRGDTDIVIDSTATLTTANIAAQADASATGGDANTWYLFKLSGTNVNPGLKVLFSVIEGGGRAYIDDVLLTTQSLTVPNGWMSAANIDNRGDIRSTGAATENYLNYIDTWGIPGDAPALVRWRLPMSLGAARELMWVGRGNDGRYPIVEQKYWIEADELSYTAGAGAWTDDSDANFSDGHSKKYTHATGTYGSAAYQLTGLAARRFLATPRRVFARIKASETAGTFLMTAAIGVIGSETDIYQSSAQSVTATGTWDILDMGVINGAGLVPPEPQNPASNPVFNLKIQLGGLSNTATAHIDAICLLNDEEFLVWKSNVGIPAAGGGPWIDGFNEVIMERTSGAPERSYGGSLWRLPAGPVVSRTIFLIADSTYQHTLTDNMRAYLDVIPRTRHLLGTS